MVNPNIIGGAKTLSLFCLFIALKKKKKVDWYVKMFTELGYCKKLLNSNYVT